jgi:hypothetical protein
MCSWRCTSSANILSFFIYKFYLTTATFGCRHVWSDVTEAFRRKSLWWWAWHYIRNVRTAPKGFTHKYRHWLMYPMLVKVGCILEGKASVPSDQTCVHPKVAVVTCKDPHESLKQFQFYLSLWNHLVIPSFVVLIKCHLYLVWGAEMLQQ